MGMSLSKKIPAWGGSLLFHLFVLLLLIYWLQFQPTRRAPGERNAIGGIVLAKTTDTGKSYVDSDGNEFDEASPAETPSLENLLTQEFSETVLSDSLPVIGPSTGPALTVVKGSGNQLSGRGVSGIGLGGKINVTFFDTEGNGSKFVFVFDRSASMSEYGGRPLRAAKAQLLQSLEQLTELQQFNIIAFNDEFSVWRLRELPRATDQNKGNAEKFVHRVTPLGGTDYSGPLTAALRLRPDVIFFLTDGEEKDAKPGLLEDIRRQNPGIQINTIQFGIGIEPKGPNFLRTLASQNQGQYQYINVAELRDKGQ